MKFNRKLNLKKKQDSFVSHFQLLGLNSGECRTNVIRSAAQAMSAALGFRGEHHVEDLGQRSADDVRRARIAVAAYRLLDPRERTDVYERVQLCFPIDRDEADSQSPPVGKLLNQMPVVRLPSNRDLSKDLKNDPQKNLKRGVQLLGQSLIEKSMEDSMPSDEGFEAKGQIPSVGRASSELSIEERRGIIRLLRESGESTLRGLSPLGWLRSRLGI